MLRSVSLLALASAALTARADFIDFESDTLGNKANGFMSLDSANVSFSAPAAGGLLLDNADGGDLIGRGLIVGPQFGGALRLDFTQSYTSLSLVFGNDDAFNGVGSRAILELFQGAASVGTVSVLLNLNNLADQTIAYSGAAFDGATFRYLDVAGNDASSRESVDNINFTANSVPGPAAALPFALMAVRRRKRA